MMNGLRVMPLALALARMPASFFQNSAADAEIALRSVKSVSDLIRGVLELESPVLAGRLAGAYAFLGDRQKSRGILNAAQAPGCFVNGRTRLKRRPQYSAGRRGRLPLMPDGSNRYFKPVVRRC
jgi:hypothetical protein